MSAEIRDYCIQKLKERYRELTAEDWRIRTKGSREAFIVADDSTLTQDELNQLDKIASEIKIVAEKISAVQEKVLTLDLIDGTMGYEAKS
jgi:maltooligosyltrehalose synthase